MGSDLIEILLSSFNGELFLGRLLDSIFNQTIFNWRLIIRDDGSTDNSVGLVMYYKNLYPDKIVFIEDGKGNLGAKNSYSELLNYANTPYIAFCDQDDIWKENKLEVMLNRMKREELQHGVGMPILVHSDLELRNEQLNLIDSSFYNFTGLNPNYVNSSIIFSKNVIPGCAMLLNKSLVDLAKHIPKEAIMHDYWFVLHAKYFGKISFINNSLLVYRQHKNNSLGVYPKRTIGFNDFIRQFFWYRKNNAGFLTAFKPYQDQLEKFLQLFKWNDLRLSKQIEAFVKLNSNQLFFKRKWLILFYQLKRGSFLENLEFLLFG